VAYLLGSQHDLLHSCYSLWTVRRDGNRVLEGVVAAALRVECRLQEKSVINNNSRHSSKAHNTRALVQIWENRKGSVNFERSYPDNEEQHYQDIFQPIRFERDGVQVLRPTVGCAAVLAVSKQVGENGEAEEAEDVLNPG
jgi:hypothetical protein